MSFQVLRGDARRLPLPDGCVDLVVTSPPYFALRSYQDGGEHYAGQVGSEPTPGDFLDALIECTREMVRVLKPSGSIWVNLGDKYSGYFGPRWKHDRNPGGGERQPRDYRDDLPTSAPTVWGIPNKSLMGLPWRYAIRCIDERGLILRAEVIWSKPNGLPESVTDRVRRSHEQWFHFTVRPRYYAAVDTIREPHIHGGNGASWDERKANGQAMRHGDTGGGASLGASGPKLGNPLGKLPGSVWSIPSQPLSIPATVGVDHFAAFPMEWPRRLILGWSPIGGCVLDPFGGTGTTALMADVLGRHGVSVDMSADYCRAARWRINDPGERARAMQVERPAPVPDGQLGLFEGAG